MVDNADIAFLALGAEHGMAKLDSAAMRKLSATFDGYIGIIREVIGFAGVLDEVWQENNEEFPGVWAYEVAEPAGEAIVKLVASGDPADFPTVREIVREIARDAARF